METTTSECNAYNIKNGILCISVNDTSNAIESIANLEVCDAVGATRCNCSPTRVDYHHKKNCVGMVYGRDGLLVVAPASKFHPHIFRYQITKALLDNNKEAYIVNEDLDLRVLADNVIIDTIKMAHS